MRNSQSLYEGCSICNVYCIPHQSIFRGLKYIFSLSESISERARYAGLCRSCRDCTDDQVSIFFSFEKEKKSHYFGSGENCECGKTVTFTDFKQCFNSSGECDGTLSWSKPFPVTIIANCLCWIRETILAIT